MEEEKEKHKRIKWWWLVLVGGMIFFFLFWGSRGWERFSPPRTWSDVAILTKEIEEKGRELNQILQEKLQLIPEGENSEGR